MNAEEIAKLHAQLAKQFGDGEALELQAALMARALLVAIAALEEADKYWPEASMIAREALAKIRSEGG